MTRTQRIALSAATLLLIAVMISLFSLSGYGAVSAVVAGAWWGLVPLVLLGGVSAAVPAQMIRWRETAVAKCGYQTGIGRWFSERFATTRPRPWESAVARSRVRMFGMVEVIVWLGVGVVLLLAHRLCRASNAAHRVLRWVSPSGTDGRYL